MDLSMFLKSDYIEGKEAQYKASSLFKEENGEKISWRFKRLSVDEVEQIRQSCFIRSENGIEIDPLLFNRRLAAASVVEPDLHNAALQDSYGVKRPEELITKLFADIGEYDLMVRFVAELNGLGTQASRIEAAKN